MLTSECYQRLLYKRGVYLSLCLTFAPHCIFQKMVTMETQEFETNPEKSNINIAVFLETSTQSKKFFYKNEKKKNSKLEKKGELRQTNFFI